MSGPELVYQLDITEVGTLSVEVKPLTGSSLQPVVYMRHDPGVGGAGGGPSACEDDAKTHLCAGLPSSDQLLSGHLDPGSYFLFIDGLTQSAGEYTLKLDFTSPECGDAVTNPPSEECDDGNTDPNDGCDECEVTTVSLFDECPGEPLVLYAGNPVVLSGWTTPYTHHYANVAQPPGCGSPGQTGVDGGKDRVYHIITDASGTLTASVGYDGAGTQAVCLLEGTSSDGCWDRVLYVYGTDLPDCGDPTKQLACSDGAEWTAVEETSLPVAGTSRYFLVVDGYSADEYGSYNLHLSLVAD